jgi:hypothetical protein
VLAASYLKRDGDSRGMELLRTMNRNASETIKREPGLIESMDWLPAVGYELGFDEKLDQLLAFKLVLEGLPKRK